MLYDTILVIVLAISTILILHVVLVKYIGVHPFVESFIRGGSRGAHTFPQRPLLVSPPAPHHISHTPHGACQSHPDASTRALTHPHPTEAKPLTANDTSMHSLETELKQWMQQEAMNWSTPAANTSNADDTSHNAQTTHTTHKMSTSIDKLFADQQVQLNDVHVPPSSHTTEPTPPSSSSPTQPSQPPTNTQYNNTMNSGDLGEGLSAFDSLESSFATV